MTLHNVSKKVFRKLYEDQSGKRQNLEPGDSVDMDAERAKKLAERYPKELKLADEMKAKKAKAAKKKAEPKKEETKQESSEEQ